ncbi:plasmid maintenance protein (plasmid) [Borreliella burgdorferi]|uniref:plasmid maintenance protein n=1 Tax=Borreliella burgdorferi TaxID=139 RepID=UPI003EBB8B49
MNIIILKKARSGKLFLHNLLAKLISLNSKKSCTNTIKVSQVKSLIKKMLSTQYDRLLKVYWAINIKNKNYKKTCGAMSYSACDIYRITANLLKKDGKKGVSIRTLQRDIKILNEIGLIQTKLRKFGKNNIGHGSVSHYIQNMELATHHKRIIWEYLFQLLEEKLENKKIVGDFDEDIKNAVFKTKKSIQHFNNALKIENANCRVNKMSYDVSSSVLIKAKLRNNNYKNSSDNSKILKNNLKFGKNDIETRLTNIGIEKDFLYRIKELSNNDSTYINALFNLEMALNDYKDSNLSYLLQHFLGQFYNYRHKVWMMMKRSDGVISDYEVIWQERFRKFVEKKEQLNEYVKKVLAIEAKEREDRRRQRLGIPNSENQESIRNDKQYGMNKVLEKNCVKYNRSNIVKDSLGFKSFKGITLESLGIGKNQFKSR